jgi:hypothetical protein
VVTPPYQRLVLHIGQAKTGTTTLQRALARARVDLARAGFDYPKTLGHRDAHHGLAPGLFGGERSTQYIQRLVAETPEQAEDQSRAALDQLANGRGAAPTLLLSSEAFYKAMSREQLSRAETMLRRLAQRIEVVVYLREPASFHLSWMNTHLQAYRFRPVPARTMRKKVVSAYSALADQLTVVAADGLDTTAHFADLLGVKLPRLAPRNMTLSAEAMELCLSFAKDRGAGDGGRPTRRGILFREALRRADRLVALPSKPRLHDHIREEIWRASEDLHWLRDEIGCTFQGGDYAIAGQSPSFAFSKVQRVAELCHVDEERLSRLSRALRPLM